MKKALSVVLALLLVVSCFALIACNDTEVVTGVTLQGLQSTYVLGDEINYSNIKLVIEHSANGKEEFPLTSSGVSYEPIDTTEEGSFEFVASYGMYTAKMAYQVVAPAVEMIMTYTYSQGYTAYQSAIRSDKGDESGETVFANLDASKTVYTVGNDNGFVFLPLTIGITEEEEEITLKQVKTTSQVFLGETELTGDALAQYVTVANNVYYFTKEAADKIFRIDVKYNDKYMVGFSEAQKTISLTVKVVNGYNVYDARGLAVLDNLNNKAWGEIKENTKLSWDGGKTLAEFADVERVIIHNDIRVTRQDLPTAYFWTGEEGSAFVAAKGRTAEQYKDYLIGSLKEGENIEDWEGGSCAQRGLYTNNGICINGNFHTLSYESGLVYEGEGSEKTFTGVGEDGGIYLVNDFNDGEGCTDAFPEPHYSFVAFRDYNTTKTNAVVENVYMLGEMQTKAKGEMPAGLMAINSSLQDITVSNVIALNFFTTFELDYGANLSAADCKFYDNFSNMVYAYRSNRIDIANCQMKRAGGPIFIIDNANSDYCIPINVTIDKDSVLESWLTGSETWFVINNVPSSIVNSIIPLANGAANGKFIQAGDYTRINMQMAVIPSPGDLMTNQTPLQAEISIGNANGTTTKFSFNDWVFKAILTAGNSQAAGQLAPFIAGLKQAGLLQEGDGFAEFVALYDKLANVNEALSDIDGMIADITEYYDSLVGLANNGMPTPDLATAIEQAAATKASLQNYRNMMASVTDRTSPFYEVYQYGAQASKTFQIPVIMSGMLDVPAELASSNVYNNYAYIMNTSTWAYENPLFDSLKQGFIDVFNQQVQGAMATPGIDEATAQGAVMQEMIGQGVWAEGQSLDEASSAYATAMWNNNWANNTTDNLAVFVNPGAMGDFGQSTIQHFMLLLGANN